MLTADGIGGNGAVAQGNQQTDQGDRVLRVPTQRELDKARLWLARSIKPHKLDPVVPKPTPGQMLALMWSGRQEYLIEIIEKRRHVISKMENDPLVYGHRLDCWKDADRLLAAHDEIVVLGGNRASKSEWAGRKVMEIICAKDGATAWCLHSTLPSSIEMQQPIIRRNLPALWREVGKRGRTTNVSWTEKNGFSEQVFVLPNGSRCRFLNYSMDKQVIEGGELDVIWCDELVPYDWVETLRYRTATRKGKLIITFTPVNGHSMVVKDYVAGSTVAEWRSASLLTETSNVTVDGRPGPVGMMPYTRTCAKNERAVIYFFGEMNPFGGFDQIRKTLTGLPKHQIMIRGYGYTERMETQLFPKFCDVHIVAPDKIPKKGTNYCVTDPAGVKNWFIKWYRVVKVADDVEHVFLYREWPDKQRYGEWALTSEKPEGKAGPAQKSEAGRGIREYKRLILQAEGWVWDDENQTWTGTHAEQVEDRIIDPRYGGAEVVTVEEPTSLIAMMADEQIDRSGVVHGPAMYWRPAGISRGGVGAQMETSVQMVNDMLDYDVQKNVDIFNCPRWYVSSDCEQSIYAYREFQGCSEKEHLKDIVDCDRYFVKSDCHHVDTKVSRSHGGGSY